MKGFWPFSPLAFVFVGLELQIVDRRYVSSSSGADSDETESDVSIRFEVDRSITPMSHVSYQSPPSSDGQFVVSHVCDELARRLWDAAEDYDASLARVHMFSNFITVYFDDSELPSGLESEVSSVINKLFIHYLPGVEPTPVEVATPEQSPEGNSPQQ